MRALGSFVTLLAVLSIGAPAVAQQPPPPPDDPTRPARIRAALAQLRSEPTVEDVQEAAMRHFRLQSNAIDSLRNRATSRAFLPTVTVSGNLAQVDRDRSVIDPLVVLQTSDQSDDRTLTGAASLEWDLAETVFNPAELQAYALVGYQVQIIKEVTRLFYVRQQIMLSLMVDPPADIRAHAALDLRVAEFTALIDSYTGGAYRRMLRRRSSRGAPPPDTP